MSKENSRLRVVGNSLVFWGLNALLFGAISLNYFRQLYIEFSGAGTLFCVLTTLGHFAMLALIGWLVFAFPWAIAFPRKPVWKILSGTVSFFAATVLLIDTFVFGLYRYHVYNEFVLDLLLGGDAGGIFVFTGTQFVLAGMAFFLLVAVEVFFIWVAGKIAPKFGKIASGSVIGIFAISLAGAHFIHAYFSANGSRDVYEIAEVYPVYFPLTANRFLLEHGLANPDEIREKVKAKFEGALDYPRSELVPAQTPTKNVLVIFIDSWNARTFEPETMPNICKFAEKSQVFEKHFSGDHGTRTGVLSFFHGIPGLYFNTIREGGVSAAFIDVFVHSGYEMGIFATAGLSSPPFDRTVFANVPAPLHHEFSSRSKDVASGDVAMTDAWLKWLEEQQSVPEKNKKPFFGFLFYDELHAMTLPADAEKKFPTDWTAPRYEILGKNTDPVPYWNLYKNDAFWLDKQIERVIEDLRSRGLLENTIVILTGDHGQEFNESNANLWGHGSAFTPAQLHVPFILFDATLQPKKFTHWTAHYDASVTILQNYLNVKNPASDYSIGKNLFDETPRDWLLVGHPEQFGIIEKDKITHIRFDRTYEIYDYSWKVIPDAKMSVPVFQAALEQARAFYKK